MTALEGLRVIELSSERGTLAGKLLADMGAEVVVVEPPGGDRMRSYEPFLRDEPGPERSLYWWHYNTNKKSVTLDLDEESDRDRLRGLIASSDLFIACEPKARLMALGLGYEELRAATEGLIMVSVTPFGYADPRSAEPANDLTILAGAGPVWSCGYDDHGVPPVRGGGNQGYHTACHFAVMAAMVAVVARDAGGSGQHVDVSAHAASNVTTEAATYQWLIAGETVQRQTGRHASILETPPSQTPCGDGRLTNSTIPARTPQELQTIVDWLEEMELTDEFPDTALVSAGAALELIDLAQAQEDEELMAILYAARDARNFIASKLPAHDFFVAAQSRGLAVGIIYSPDEALEDSHLKDRGFCVEVEHDELGRSFTYPGAPYRFHGSPWSIRRRAPLIGEHDEEILGHTEASE